VLRKARVVSVAAVILAIAVAILVPGRPSEAAVWLAPVNISQASERGCSVPAVAAAPDGRAFVVYRRKNPDWRLIFRERSASGVWGPHEAFSVPWSERAAIAYHPDGSVWVFYAGAVSGGKTDLYQARRVNGVWTVTNMTGTADRDEDYARVRITPDGRVHLVYTEDKGIRYRVWNGSWSAPAVVGTCENPYYHRPDITVDSAGRVHIIWEESRRLLYRRFDGTSWSGTAVLGTTADFFAYGKIASGAAGLVVVTFDQVGNGVLKQCTSVDGGQTWTPLSQFTAGHYPNMAEGAAGRVHLIYQEIPGARRLLYRAWGTGGWSAAEAVVSGDLWKGWPSIAEGGGDSLHVAFDHSETLSYVAGSISGTPPSGGAIEGTVRDTNGNPIGGATVTTSPGGYTATTGSDGFYRMWNVAPGTYSVTAQKAGYTTQTHTNRNVVAGQITVVDFTLSVIPGAISGVVRDSANNPVSGATVSTTPGGYTALTNTSGQYTISNVPPGTYTVQASKSGYGTVTRSNVQVVFNQTTTVNFTFPPAPGTISGVVRDSANNPISAVTVSTTPGGYTAFTNTSGQYTISNVPPGTYTVEAYKSGYGSVTQSNVQVVSNQTTTVNFTFSTGSGTITGTVRDSASNPLSGVTVRTVGASFSAVTNQSGQYTLSNVPAGTYTLEASKSGYVTQTQSNVQVVANQTTTVNFTLIANLGQITGTVRDGCNTPIGGATVRTTTGGYTATTAQDGSYTISNITGGTYTVEASKDGFITQTVANVSVNAGQSTQVNFNLPVLVQSDVLVNGDFEGGYTSFWGGRIANGWGATFRNSESASNCAWLANNQGGTVGYTQRIYLDYQGGEAGIIQVVSGLTPGAQFRFSAWAYQSSPNSTCWIGADPNGGTTLPARQTAFINNPSRWNYQEVTGTVGPSGRVSVFLWVWHQWLPAGQCYFNDARLVVTAPGSPGRIRGFVREPNNTPVAGATVSTDFGGYTTATGSDGSYTLLNVSPGTYNLTVSKQGYESQTQSVTVSGCQETVRDFVITEPLEKVQNGNMEGGFWSTGWSTACSGVPSVLPNPRGAWGWNNDPSVPFNTFSSTTIKRSGGYSLGMAFCQSAPSPGKLGVVWQTVYLGAPNASKTFTVYAYHTDGNCPSIMCWNPGISQPDPTVAAANGRFQWVTTDNWGQRNTWVGRSMTVTADSTGYVTIMFGGAAHPGTVPGARIYFDDISVR